VVGETHKRFRIRSLDGKPVHLAGRSRYVAGDATALVPKHALRFLENTLIDPSLVDTGPRPVLYRCYLRSAPGMWTTYDGHVDMRAPDRPSLGSWRLEHIEAIDG
jgi:hypothetical protein